MDIRAVDVILPCLDEVEALPWVLGRMPGWARPIVVDNGSTDGSAELARELGATVVMAAPRGYGAACPDGLEAATADLVAFMDADGSLDPQQLSRLTDAYRGGRQLVTGRRVPRSAGAWPWPLRLANRVVLVGLRRRCGLRLRDVGPMRLAPRLPLLALDVGDRRSGYPLETVLRAARAGWAVEEVDVDYRPRTGRSKVTGTPRGAAQTVRDMSRVLSS
ncbi:MAG: glycosyltransferase family 2 protein [Oryzihumus sp.]